MPEMYGRTGNQNPNGRDGKLKISTRQVINLIRMAEMFKAELTAVKLTEQSGNLLKHDMDDVQAVILDIATLVREIAEQQSTDLMDTQEAP